MNYEMEELLPVVADLTERYTSKESSSVTYETARQLMKAALYCIRQCPQENELETQEGLSAELAYQTGYEKLIQKVKAAQQRYNVMILTFDAYGNENYYDTVVNAIPGFFRLYDARFAPQDTIITMDYPTLLPLDGLEGIEAVERYIEYITQEQKFLSKMPKEYIDSTLTAYQKDYREQFYNICGIVLRNILACMITEKMLLAKGSKAEYRKLEESVRQYESTVLEEKLGILLKRLICEQYDNNEKILQYLSGDLKNFAFELSNAVENNHLSRVVVL